MTTTNTDSIDVRSYWGGVLADESVAGEKHRWWFDVTDQNRLVHSAEVVTNDGERVYVSEHNHDVPDRVLCALESFGFETVLDSSGQEL